MASDRQVVLVADRGPEAAPIAEALRRADLAVVTCDVVALPERVTRIDPIAMLVDAEQPHAEAVLERLVEQEGRRGLPAMAIVGSPGRGPRLGLASGARVRWWSRPIEPSQVVAFLLERVSRALGERTDIPSSVGSMPLASESDAMLMSDFPALAGLPEVESILPELTHGGAASSRAGALSPEIEALLDAAAQRVEGQPGEPNEVGEEPRVLVPPEMMNAVDDLLAGEEESPATRGGMNLAELLDPMLGTPPRDDAREMKTASEIPMSSRREGASEPPPGTQAQEPRTANQEQQTVIKGDSDTFFKVEGPPQFPPPTRPESPHETPDGEEPRPTAPGDLEPGWAGPVPPGQSYVDPEPAGSFPGGASGSRGAPSGPRPPVPYPRSPSAPPAPSSGTGIGMRFAHAVDPVDPPSTRDASPSTPPPSTSSGHRFSTRPPDAAQPSAGFIGSRPVSSGVSPATRPGMSEPPPHTSFGGPFAGGEPMPASGRAEQGDPFLMLARAVRDRATGALAFDDGDGRWPRRILLREGDLTNAASDEADDALVRYLVSRGDLAPEVARAGPKLPQSGRHAAAALIARGILEQDELWSTLRAHAEWLVARILQSGPKAVRLESAPPERLRAEPNVFGGAAGAEIYVDAVRRVLPPEAALQRLGGLGARLRAGTRGELMVETALGETETGAIRAADGKTIGDLLAVRGPDFGSLLYALVCLEVLELDAIPGPRAAEPPEPTFDPLDAEAVRQRVQARLSLVREADYFTLLGVNSAATPYEIKRAFLKLRRNFEPTRLLTPATADLADDLQLILDVLEEAYEVLREPGRRRRYQRALEAAAPTG